MLLQVTLKPNTATFHRGCDETRVCYVVRHYIYITGSLPFVRCTHVVHVDYKKLHWLPWVKKLPQYSCLTDFHNPFTARLKFVTKSSLKIPPHPQLVATLPHEVFGTVFNPQWPCFLQHRVCKSLLFVFQRCWLTTLFSVVPYRFVGVFCAKIQPACACDKQTDNRIHRSSGGFTPHLIQNG